MAHFVTQQWELPRQRIGKGRTRTCEFQAFVPDPLVGRSFAFNEECAADIARAEKSIRALEAGSGALSPGKPLARLLLRAEASASSSTEGLEANVGRLMRAELAGDFDNPGTRDLEAEEVLADIDAMMDAMLWASSQSRITHLTLLQVHERIMRMSPLRPYAGRVRTSPSWIGGQTSNPCFASFVPPPHKEVPRLLSDVAQFCNDKSLPAVAQAALVHAQFETIHPFVDGNGRTGRALIHVLFQRRGLVSCWCPPVALVLGTWPRRYALGLDAFHLAGEPDSPEVQAGMNAWVSFFARACSRAVKDTTLFEMRVREIQAEWLKRLTPLPGDPLVYRFIQTLPSLVVTTVERAARYVGTSPSQAEGAMQKLVKARVLKEVRVGKRNRVFEATDLVAAFTQFERRLASPAGDTRVASPIRPVPRRQR